MGKAKKYQGIYQRGGKGMWWARYKDEHGQWVDRRTPEEDPAAAKEIRDEWARLARRLFLGIDKAPELAAKMTVWELAVWWLGTYSSQLHGHATNLGMLRKHLMPSKLGAMITTEVEPGDVEGWLVTLDKVLHPRSVNHMRKYIGRIYAAARRGALKLKMSSPASDTRPRDVPEYKPDHLRAHEVQPVLLALSDYWRPLFAMALYTGMRLGELVSLRKDAVNLMDLLVYVRTSWGHETKAKKEQVIPIAHELVPYLKEAMKASPNALMFPKSDGKMYTHAKKPQLAPVLRRALRRAGIVTGWTHTCRRLKVDGAAPCGHVETAADGMQRRCPKCNRKLWPSSTVRPIKFHELRHSTASLLTGLGIAPARIKEMCRHSSMKVTEGYAHLAPEYMRDAVDAMRFNAPVAAISGGFATPLLPGGSSSDQASSGASAFLSDSGSLQSRDGEIRTRDPLPPSLGAAGQTGYHSVSGRPLGRDIIGITKKPAHTGSPPLSPFATGFATPLLPTLRALPPQDLTVADVADRLGLSTATVYKLCDKSPGDGGLGHYRVVNSIRVTEADLAAFIAGSRKPRP